MNGKQKTIQRKKKNNCHDVFFAEYIGEDKSDYFFAIGIFVNCTCSYFFFFLARLVICYFEFLIWIKM